MELDAARAAAAGSAGCEDGFDRLPDDVVVRVLDLVSDVRTLARCRCLSRRFAALVPEVERLHLEVDAVVPPSSSPAAPFFFSSSPAGSGLLFLIVPLLHRVLFSLLNSISALLYDDDDKPARAGAAARVAYAPPGEDGRRGQQGPDAATAASSPCAPALIRGFHRVRALRIELPAGDRPRISSKGAAAAVLRWRAVFGKQLRTCVILAARSYGPMVVEDGDSTAAAAIAGGGGGHDDEETEQESATGLKERVIWTIGALIAASARHHMAREVALGEKGEGMESLVVADRDGEGVVAVQGDGLREWRKDGEEIMRRRREEEEGGSSFLSLDNDGDPGAAERKGRTTVPAVRMTMRHAARVDLGGGVGMRGAALVVVRAAAAASPELDDERALVEAAFQEDGVLLAAAQQVLKRPSYLLEMNSF